MTKERIPAGEYNNIGIYDVAVSDISLNGTAFECMAFSGYRRVGCGDVYLSLREKASVPQEWGTPYLVLRQEDVPFHNRPDSPHFEWGLEGAKILQLADDAFLMIGVCFLERDKSYSGTRQRVFFAAASSPGGPYSPMYMPIDPTQYGDGQGENGHPDIIDLGNYVGILYQERAGDFKPWHLRYVEMTKDDLKREIHSHLRVKSIAQNRPLAP